MGERRISRRGLTTLAHDTALKEQSGLAISADGGTVRLTA
jgi:hypothetical protein